MNASKNPFTLTQIGGDLVRCKACIGTGFSDRVWRDAWTMEPREKICAICHGRGWVKTVEKAAV